MKEHAQLLKRSLYLRFFEESLPPNPLLLCHLSLVPSVAWMNLFPVHRKQSEAFSSPRHGIGILKRILEAYPELAPSRTLSTQKLPPSLDLIRGHSTRLPRTRGAGTGAHAFISSKLAYRRTNSKAPIIESEATLSCCLSTLRLGQRQTRGETISQASTFGDQHASWPAR